MTKTRPPVMRRIPLCLLAFLTFSHADEEGENWADLFNGKDLTGWVNVNCAPETWSVKDGMIHCTGKPTGALRTSRQYENFILELEWRHLKPRGNAGVFIWAGPISAKGQPFLRAIEVQVLENAYGKSDSHTTHGDVFPIHGSSMKPHGRHNGMRSFPSEELSKSSPEWNHYRIVCKDAVLRLEVNGKEVSGGSDCIWRKGYIALESEGSPVDFRKIRIRELPGSDKLDQEMSAPDSVGFKALYNGVDFRGWKIGKDAPGWKSNDWRIACEDSKSAVADLWTENQFENFELIVDWRRDKEKGDSDSPARGGVLLKDGKMLIPCHGPAGQWQRLEVSFTRDEDGISILGAVGSDFDPDVFLGLPIKGPIGLQHGTGVKFANLYIREL
jgi:hypothetical protein